MQFKIKGQEPFQILSDSFSISPSNEGYTLQISADGENYSDLFQVSANTTKMCTGMANGSFYRLSGNNSEVVVNWRTTCKSQGGGGGGTGPQGPQGPQGPAGGGGDSAQTMALISAAINANNENLEEGDPIVGMAKQLYSPNGTTSNGTFAYRTTAGDADVTSGPANLMKVMGNAIYPQTEYNDSAVLMREGSEVEGFDAEIGWDGDIVPNDIPYGESTYTYDGSDWTPSLPQAVTAMTLNSETYSPESGDEIVINRSLSKTGSASYPQPYSFVALGLNSFSKDGSPINSIEQDEYKIQVIDEGADYNLVADSDYAVYAIKAVTGLSNGYVVYHKSGSSISWAGVYDPEENDMVFSATIRTSTYNVVFPTAEFPYIVFSARKDEEGMICVHPRWSGYMDEEYEDYSESVLDIHSFNAICPLISVGTTKNVWDFENGKLIKNIDVIDYSADEIDALINDGKTLGTDFDFDEYYIYKVSSNPVETSITFDNGYDANDFSVEYFTDVNDSDISAEAAGVETYYMQNLVDKLRRMEAIVEPLTSFASAGETGKLYERNGRLFKWVNGAGVWGEWLSGWDSNNQYPGSNGDVSVIFKYSTLPVGELCRVYDFNNLRTYLVYDGEKITAYTDAAHTTVHTAVTMGCVDVNMSNQTYGNYKVLLTWTDGKLIFKTGSNASLRNRANTAVSGPHYEALDMSVAASNDAGTGDSGLPIWNKEGIVIGKMVGYNNKTMYFNTTGYTNNKNFLAGPYWNGPDRIFVPTQGGTQGQVLTSNGNNAEPVWETMIKAQKITSDAYEALTVKDPNTLYLIDDE